MRNKAFIGVRQSGRTTKALIHLNEFLKENPDVTVIIFARGNIVDHCDIILDKEHTNYILFTNTDEAKKESKFIQEVMDKGNCLIFFDNFNVNKDFVLFWNDIVKVALNEKNCVWFTELYHSVYMPNQFKYDEIICTHHDLIDEEYKDKVKQLCLVKFNKV